ncbi:MAG: protein kinase, partial [Acidobacteriota bacterium]
MTDASKDRLGHYEIRERLGAGGMGEVYLADDTKLKRRVAIKFLGADSAADAHAKRRLLLEAQAAAALDHPNICAIHEVGELDDRAFIVMQYVEGETLAARIQGKALDLKEALALAVQIADALAEAAAHGMIHRDIKPQNIMITARGQAKVLDFGLAKVVADLGAGAGDGETRSLLTQPGAIVGTAPYMSPEQVKGEALDARSDIFSFGAVLYEMLSGRRAFGARTAAETISAVLTASPPPLASYSIAVPSDLEQILRRCLEKDRSRRFQSMREVLTALDKVRQQVDSGVVSATTARNEEATASTAAVSLGRSRGAGVKGRFVLIGAIAVTSAIPLYLSQSRTPPAAADAKTPAVNSVAYDLFLRGKINVGSENRDANDTAIKLLQQAVAADPSYAPAYAQLARAYNIKAFYFAASPESERLNEDAAVAIEKALRLDPNLAEAYLARGLLLWTHQNRFPHDQAAQSYKRAIALDANLDEAHHQLALVYMHVGLLDKARTEIEQAIKLNPSNTMARFRVGVIDLYRGRYEDALAIFNSTPLEKSAALLSFQKALTLAQLGRMQQARQVVDEYFSRFTTDEGGTVTSIRAMLLAKDGKTREAEADIQRAIEIGRNFGHFHHTAYSIASTYAILNRPAEAIKWLQTAADDGFP